MKVKRITKTAKMPYRAYPESAGLDLYADSYAVLMPGVITKVSTGLSIALPALTVGLVWPRSGLSKSGVDTLAGVIDEDFRGELCVMLTIHGKESVTIKPGDRVAQLLVQPVFKPELVEVDELPDTIRGDGGFGSSGD